MKLSLLCICWASLCLVNQIEGHCLRQTRLSLSQSNRSQPAVNAGPPDEAATRHMWLATDSAAYTGSCAGPTTLRLATDSRAAVANSATAIATANFTATDKAAPAVSLANYVYQCAAKRAVNPTPDLAATKSLQLGRQQQLTVPAILLQLAKIWGGI